jgi:hypothetical protein
MDDLGSLMAACWISSLVARDAAAESGQTGWFGEEVNIICQPRSQGHLAHASSYVSYIQLDRMLAVIALRRVMVAYVEKNPRVTCRLQQSEITHVR